MPRSTRCSSTHSRLHRFIKAKVAHTRLPELIPVLGSQPAGDVSHKPGGRLPLLSARPAVTHQFRCSVNGGTMCVKSLPKIVTRQRRGCDLNPDPSATESSTLTTRLPSHPRFTQAKLACVCLCFKHPPPRLASRRPVRSDMTTDIITQWREDWSSASVANHTTVTDPTILQPVFHLPRHTWSLMNRFLCLTSPAKPC